MLLQTTRTQDNESRVGTVRNDGRWVHHRGGSQNRVKMCESRRQEQREWEFYWNLTDRVFKALGWTAATGLVFAVGRKTHDWVIIAATIMLSALLAVLALRSLMLPLDPLMRQLRDTTRWSIRIFGSLAFMVVLGLLIWGLGSIWLILFNDLVPASRGADLEFIAGQRGGAGGGARSNPLARASMEKSNRVFVSAKRSVFLRD